MAYLTTPLRVLNLHFPSHYVGEVNHLSFSTSIPSQLADGTELGDPRVLIISVGVHFAEFTYH